MLKIVSIEVLTMIRRELLDTKSIRMNSEPIYQLLDYIELHGNEVIHHSVITDEKNTINNKLMRDFILRERSIIFDEGDTLTDGYGYTVVKNGEWSDYKELPKVGKCKFCKLTTTE